MTQTPDSLQQQGEDIAQVIRTAFLDEPLPATTRIGCGHWTRRADGNIEYVYGGDGLYIEAFFRGVDPWRDLIGDTPEETGVILHRFFLAPPPAKRWTEVVGAPLLSWIEVTWSLDAMTPKVRAYYLPAYLLTALPLLAAFPSGSVTYREGQASPLEFVGHIMDMLLPPSDAIDWDDLVHLPPERFEPSHQMQDAYRAEDFLRFIQPLTETQKQAIQYLVAFALRTYPLYVPPGSSCQQEVALLTRFWLEPTFSG